jgi:hypothetical protein
MIFTLVLAKGSTQKTMMFALNQMNLTKTQTRIRKEVSVFKKNTDVASLE